MATEEDLEEAMMELYRKTFKETEGKYKPNRYRELIEDCHGKEAARRLLSGKDPQDGFDILYRMGRPELTFESFILKHPEFHHFLDPEHLKKAKKRLKDYFPHYKI